MNDPETYSVTIYSREGDALRTELVNTAELETATTDVFAKKFLHLSGDLELPLEGRLPGSVEYLDYRIGSDRNGAYVLYYFHDEVIFASLLLSGTDDVVEMELMHVFKFLLLDTEDADEPTEEDIDAVLDSEHFDFAVVQTRPAMFEVQLADPEEDAPIEHVENVNRHLGAAFFAMDRNSS